MAIAGQSVWAQSERLVDRRESAMHQLQQAQPNVQFLDTGGNIERVYGVPFGGGFSFVESAKSFADNYADLFKVGDGKFMFDRLQPIMDGKFMAAYFNEFVEGVPVENGTLTVLMKPDIGYPIVLASARGEAVSGPLPK
jgi:hypothetical protein